MIPKCRSKATKALIIFGISFTGQLAAAVEPYPALPPSLSTSVTPNVMLHVDNSGSMSSRPAGSVSGTPSKITTAKTVAKDLIAKNSSLRWGLFSFDPNADTQGGKLRAPAGSSLSTLNTAIDGLSADTWTPLGENMFEMTRYFAGESSFYGKISGNYTSPMQYRCQKNFAIIITDGVATKDNDLPGVNNKNQIDYRSYDVNDSAITRPFKICTNTTNVSSYLTCPAKLEGSTVNNPFTGSIDDTASNNYARSLRDVAMYAYDRDFMSTGLDLDGKSWNDPKFIKQNLLTYTVGFAINDPVLKATATVGHGKYYTAADQTTLVSALQNAVDDIVSSISNAGGVATQSETTSVGNKVFQPVFNPTGWYGLLRCLTLNGDGTVGAACTPNASAVIPQPNLRKVFTSKVVGTVTTPFSFSETTYSSDMTVAQKAFLGGTSAEQKNTINFIRGVEGITGFRSRYNNTVGSTVLLGDIVDGQPVVVSKPNGATSDSAYTAFTTTHADRNIVLVGANDGMLHAFRIEPTVLGGSDNMTELMGYIPSAVYPRLRSLTASDYGLDSGTPHVYHVNGNMRQQDIKTSTGWKTIVVGGLGQGGQGYYAIDSTDTSKFDSASSAVKWEWTDVQNSSLGYTFGAPLIYNVRTSATTVVPAVILSNGYESGWADGSPATATTNKSILYVLNADTGQLLKSITLPAVSTGLSSPVGMDVGQDGILDFAYAGDVNGNLWRFDFTDNSPSNFKVITTPIFSSGIGQPIINRPAVMPVYKKSDGTILGNIVLFGTGQLLTNSDRASTTTQTLYGVLDTMNASPTTVPKSELQEQKFEATTYTVDAGSTTRVGTYRKISTSDADASSFDLTSDSNWEKTTPKKGWFINLNISSERAVTTPMLYSDKVLFGTGIPISNEKCLPGGKGWILGLNPLTGAAVRKGNNATGAAFSFIDMNGDEKSSAADKIPFLSGTSFISGYEKNGIPTELTFVSSAANLTGPSDTFTNTYGTAGGAIALREANSMGVYIGASNNVTRGTVISRSGSAGSGTIYGGTVGSDTLDKDRLLGAPASGVRVDSTIWREIR